MRSIRRQGGLGLGLLLYREHYEGTPTIRIINGREAYTPIGVHHRSEIDPEVLEQIGSRRAMRPDLAAMEVQVREILNERAQREVSENVVPIRPEDRGPDSGGF